MPNGTAIAEAFRAMKTYLPPDVPGWKQLADPDAAASVAVVGSAGAAGTRHGPALRVFVNARDPQILMLPVAVRGVAKLQARTNVVVQVRDPGTGQRVMEQALEAGTTVDLPPAPVCVILATTTG
jgi:hypothetical protein